MEMQLKRDTDYALRILLCAVQKTRQDEVWMTIPEISKQTSIPATITGRLCRKLTDAKLLQVMELTEDASRYAMYAIDPASLHKSVFDVICVIEGRSDLFAIFNKSTELYSLCKEFFEDTDRNLTDSLKRMTLSAFQKK